VAGGRQRLLCLGLCVLAATARAQDSCEDEHEGCSAWAGAGECEKNAGFMRSTCPKSCNTCPPPLDEKLMQLSDERVVMSIAGYGEVVLAFYPNAAPVTVAHILDLFKNGCYDTNHIFRVDKGFVAQIQSVYQGAVRKEMSPECKKLSPQTVPGEFTAIRHVRGILSMGRMADPDSGGSSFSMLLGKAPHLDRQYTVFGKIVEGLDVLAEIEKVETKREGIFVMPKERIEIESARVVSARDRPEL